MFEQCLSNLLKAITLSAKEEIDLLIVGPTDVLHIRQTLQKLLHL